MIIEYRPLVGFTIDGHEINWDEPRELIRGKLNLPYAPDDRIVDVSLAYDGDHSNDIHVVRDLYGSAQNKYDLHLNYDKAERFESFEVHACSAVVVRGQKLNFGDNIANIRRLLSLINSNETEMDDGGFLYPDLKVVIASSASMGGDGEGLAYFYAASNINHLLDDN